jgi:hypothetical protein
MFSEEYRSQLKEENPGKCIPLFVKRIKINEIMQNVYAQKYASRRKLLAMASLSNDAFHTFC